MSFRAIAWWCSPDCRVLANPARLRYVIRRRPTQICGVAVGVRKAVPGANGQARRRFHRRFEPAVSIDQKTTNRNPRSTVGTITEIYDYLRLLFARTGIPHCPECGALVSAQTPQQMVDALLQYPERTRFQILAPVVRGRKGEFEDLLDSCGATATHER